MTADVDEQGGVVDDRTLLLIEANALRQPQRDHAPTQNVLHRRAELEVEPSESAATSSARRT